MRQRTFTLMEAVLAGGTFLLVLSFAMTGIDLCRNMQHRFMQRQTALTVLDNTLERLQAWENADVAQARRVLSDELDRGASVNGMSLSALCREEGNTIALQLADGHGNIVSSVKVKLQ